MRWSSDASRGTLRPTTIMITNTNDHVREVVRSTGLESAAVSFREVFLRIDAADMRQVVTQIVASESPKPAQGMTRETLLKRVAEFLKAGFRVHCIYEAGPTGFALARELIALGADCLVVRARSLERHGRRRKNDKRLAATGAGCCSARRRSPRPSKTNSTPSKRRSLPRRRRLPSDLAP